MSQQIINYEQSKLYKKLEDTEQTDYFFSFYVLLNM